MTTDTVSNVIKHIAAINTHAESPSGAELRRVALRFRMSFKLKLSPVLMFYS